MAARVPIEHDRLGRIVDEEIAADQLQPVGLPLAEARLAVVFYYALAFDRRFEQNYGRAIQQTV